MSEFIDWLFLRDLISWEDREEMKAEWAGADWDKEMELIEDWELVDEYDEWEGEEWEREILMDAKDW